ncbi:hypothetical protein PTSG_02156 [Salpingoeca rosetta]|uniref:Uncharacterized protein n=1 Tax=Salpingoeca rosetta (strain ATCC 50818 / BSB-021) TaxID=946362 RepID=F2U1D3_SALR5|nr:uncharacterized protein PTSG_02156 [Salpingoeca rosetta]EGD81435.1 hypothetical protein PTSG_02156 [Salpingoeca rosetta]|eukprot:XP_004996639.1 hypothetical protein PTSG_02156 [Salpingoeca rosetta]
MPASAKETAWPQELVLPVVLQHKYGRHRSWRQRIAAAVLDAIALHALLLALMLLLTPLMPLQRGGSEQASSPSDRARLWLPMLRAVPVAEFHRAVDEVVVHGRRLMHWVSAHPVGLKLCVPLAQFFASTFVYTVQLWTHFLHLLLDALAWLTTFPTATYTALHLLGASGCCAVAADAVAFVVPWHVVSFYGTFRFLYCSQLAVIKSVALIFMGWKYNPLRQRVDSCSFTFPELILGTLVLSIAIFCLPTTAVFYLCFCLMLLCIAVIDGLLSHAAVLCTAVLLSPPTPRRWQRRDCSDAPMAGVGANPSHGHHQRHHQQDLHRDLQQGQHHDQHQSGDTRLFCMPQAHSSGAANIVITDTLVPRPPQVVVGAVRAVVALLAHILAGRIINIAAFAPRWGADTTDDDR